MSILKFDSVRCTGCHACYSVCPTSAITMKRSEDGFLFPHISSALCVNCGMCEKVCYMGKEITNTIPDENIKCYSGYATDINIIKSSSSGGMFYLLSQKILKQGGVVFGAIYDEQHCEIKHASTDSVAIEKLMKSKYVQSNIGDTYHEVHEALSAGRNVLFTGTPCQVRGLKNYLQVKNSGGYFNYR